MYALNAQGDCVQQMFKCLKATLPWKALGDKFVESTSVVSRRQHKNPFKSKAVC